MRLDVSVKLSETEAHLAANMRGGNTRERILSSISLI